MNSNDITKKLQEVISGANNTDIKNAKQNIEQLLKSPQGQNIIKNLSEEKKEKLLNEFMNLDNNKIKDKLKNMNVSDLKGLPIDEILKKMR